MKEKIFKIVGVSAVGIFILFIAAVIFAGLSQETKHEQAKSVQGEQGLVASSSGIVVVQPNADQLPQVKVATAKNQVPISPTNKPGFVKVVAVTDGDTIKVSIDGTTKIVRLIGMDTPETVDPRKTVQCFGKEASNKTKTILLNKMVRLESDPTQGELDKYQRLLRYVFTEDGTFFNKLMIEQGYAHEYTYNIPYKYQVEFEVAEKTARETQVGLWNPSTCNGTAASTSEATQTSSTTPTQPTGHTFYLSTYYTSKFYYCDTDDGWKGLSSKYLKSYASEQELLKNYPSRTLHETCK